jgi:hypothetical protein
MRARKAVNSHLLVFGILIDDLPLSELPTTPTKTWQVVDLASGRDRRRAPEVYR